MQHRQPSTTINLVLALLKYAARLGFSPEAVFRAASLSPTLLENPESRIGYKQFNALWQSIARWADDAYFGLHLVEAMHDFPSGEILLTVMLNCPTAGEAMRKLARYHDLATDFARLQLTEQAGCAVYTVTMDGIDFSPDRHQVEAELGLLVLMLRRLTDDRMEFVEVRFSHARHGDLAEYQRLFQCPLVFGCPHNELVIRRECLLLPILGANPVLRDMLEAMAQKRLQALTMAASWTRQAAASINEQLLRGERPMLKTTASALAISPRHLQNRLKKEGTTYQTLLDRVRMETAIDYLNRPQVSMFDVAFLLGFSDQSAFNHAFRRWTGYSPKQYQLLTTG